MPKIYDWVFVKEFNGEKSLNRFYLTQVQTSTDKSNTPDCSLCHSKSHLMDYKLRLFLCVNGFFCVFLA